MGLYVNFIHISLTKASQGQSFRVSNTWNHVAVGGAASKSNNNTVHYKEAYGFKERSW